MSKLKRQVEKERVDFIFGVPLTEVVLELNELINKYGGDSFLQELSYEDEWDNCPYHCVCVEELESDEAHEHRLKYYSSAEFAEREELKRLQQKYPLDIRY
jgi:hypothetical protein